MHAKKPVDLYYKMHNIIKIEDNRKCHEIIQCNIRSFETKLSGASMLQKIVHPNELHKNCITKFAVPAKVRFQL